MKVLVTGGAGFIGSHVNKLLLDQGHQVTVVDNLSHGHKESIDPRANFFESDLNDQVRLEEILPGHDAVIHMASFIEVGESIKRPVEFTENNIVSTVKLLEAMKNTGVKKMIFSSSACVYGIPLKTPITETDPLGEQSNPYGLTKVAMEQFCMLYNKLYNFDVIILRYFNPYGEGEMHTPETHAIPNFIKAALKNEPVPLYWKGKQTRDFIYIDDLANAHILPLNLNGLHMYNIGTQNGVKVIDVVNKIFDILGYRVEINDLGNREGDATTLVASNEKIKKELNWEPKVDLDEGLKRTIKFFKNNNQVFPLPPFSHLTDDKKG